MELFSRVGTLLIGFLSESLVLNELKSKRAITGEKKQFARDKEQITL